jgi:hypothetical protein
VKETKRKWGGKEKKKGIEKGLEEKKAVSREEVEKKEIKD